MDHFPYVALLVAAILVYAPRLVTGYAQAKQPEGYDNANPRAQQERLTGIGARARAAHLNGFEGYAPFAAAVLASLIAKASVGTIALFCAGFLIARVAYIACYLADLATLRSLTWLIGMGCTVALFVLPLLR